MLEGLLARSYEAVSRKDLDAMMSYWAEDAVWEYPGETPMSGRFVGKPAIRDWWQRWLDRVATARFTVKHAAFSNPILLTWANTVIVEWEAEIATKDGLAGAPQGVTVMHFRRGKCTYARDYFLDLSLLTQIWGHREVRASAA